MKLLFFSPQFYPSIGGLQNVVQAWAIELSKRAYEIIVLTEEPFNKPEPFAFRVVRKPSFWQEVREMRDCDYVVMFNVSLKAMLQLVISRRPLVINHQTALYYPNEPIPFRQRIKKWVADYYAKKNISCSHYIAGIYKKSSVVFNPYNHLLFRNVHLPVRPKKFLFVGRLVSDKGVDLLVLAFKKVTLSIPGNYTLSIIGDGPDKLMLEQMIEDAGLQSRITISGFVVGEELVQQMNQHEVMIVPSRMEPFGIVALEGLSCGCRMIVSNTGGLPEASGGFATLFENEDVTELVNCMASEINRPHNEINLQALNMHLVRCTNTASADFFIKEIND